LSTDCADIVH